MIKTIVQTLKQPFKKKRPKLKDTLNVVQEGSTIYISGYLSNQHYDIKALHIKIRNEEEMIEIKNENDGPLFKFVIDIHQYMCFFNLEEAIADFYLFVSVPETQFTARQKENLKLKANMLKTNQETIYEYRIRLGRFKKTNFAIKDSLNSFYLYTTVRGNISMSIQHQIEQKIITQIDYLKFRNDIIKIGGRLFTRSHRLEDLRLVLISRNTGEEKIFQVDYDHLTKLTTYRFGLNRYEYHAEIQTEDLVEQIMLEDDVYDLFFEMPFIDEEKVRRVRLGRPRFRARRNLKSTASVQGDYVFTLSPYYTFRQSNLSFLVDRFDKETYEYMVRAMRYSSVIHALNRHKDIWLIGERIDKAQDTGYHLFKYIRKNYPHLNVYYVIKKDSPELDNIKHLGNILYFKSKEHIKMTLAATRIVGSHHPDYLYPIRSESFKKKVKGKKVFIQHGIMGTKNMIANYGKYTSGFETDLFLVSSDREKELVVNDLEYKQEDVVVTGLSRFDALFKNDVAKKRQLIIMPTWREWLVREDLFLESEYFERYKALINSKKLHQLADKYSFEIVVCLHTNMQKYSSHFKDAPVRVISQGDADVQLLMKESMMMITDYSSVGFDFSFLNRPVVYYQFDRNRFFGRRGSHLDIENDLPGDIVYTHNNLIENF